MLNALSVDIEDWFQVGAFEKTIARDDWDSLAPRVARNSDAVLALFARAGVKATFFTLGWVAERNPRLIRRIADAGHEVASHGWDHQRVFSMGADAFRADLHASIRRSVATHGIDYLPGSAELGDFDATSTTIALSPGDEQSRLPKALVDATFEKYWQGFIARRDGKTAWKDYTPYELRTIASFVRLGWRDRLDPLIAFFFADRRPAAWNQWAEVVGRDPREPRFVGDMPHAWIASDYVRSALDLFAYDRAADGALVLAAGVQPAWLEGDGISVRDLRTPYGRFGYTLKARNGQAELTITQPVTPPGGLVLSLPKGEVKVPVGKKMVKAPL